MIDNKYAILIVDDDANLRLTLVDILAARGYAPLATETGKAALEALDSHHADIALLDLRLEDMPGLELLRGIKTRSPNTECIILTGHATQESAIQAVNLGAYSYLQKPIDIEQLLITIQRAVEKREADQSIRESEKRFHTLAETSPVGIFRTDAGGVTTYVNPRWSEISGLPAGHALGDGWLRAVHPEDIKKVTETWKQAVEEKCASKVEYRLLRPGGETIWVLGQAAPEVDLSGKISGYIGTITDITEQKRNEAVLRESENRYRDLVDHSHDLICTHDLDGKLLSVNPAAEMISGFQEEELLNMNMRDILIPETRSQFDVYLEEIKNKGSASGLLVAQSKSGERRILEYNNSLRRQDGAAPLVRGMARDITESKIAEDALRASEARYRALVENLPAIVYIDDASMEPGCSLYVSPIVEDLLGISPQEWLGDDIETWAGRIHPHDRQRARDAYLHAFQSCEPLDCEYRLVASDGHIVWVRDQAVTLRDETGKPRWFQGVMYDISARKQAERELVESETHAQRLLNQQVAVNELALALGESHDPQTLYQVVYERVHALADAWVFIVSSFDDESRLIHAEFAMMDSQQMDVSAFPAVPLAEPGTGNQSQVIHTGEPFYVPDHRAGVKKSKHRYAIEKDGSVRRQPPRKKTPVEETLSALYVPMKAKGRVVGVMQLQSRRLDAYSADDIQLLSGMANVAAVAIQNARLHQEMQQELAERRRVEHSLGESEERFRTLFERVNDGMYRSTHAGRFVEINPAMIKMFGFASKEEMLAVDIKKELYFSPDERGSHVLDTGQEETEVYRMRRKDGSEIWVEDRGAYIHDEDGNILYHEGMLRDVTERIKAEQELRASEERYRLLLESIHDSIYILDREWRHTLVNEAASRFTGIPRNKLLGAKLTDLFPGVEKTPFFAAFQRVMDTRQPDVVSAEFRFSNGKTGWYEVLVNPVAEGILCISRDITERNHAEEALRQSEERHRTLFENSPVSLWEEDFSAVKQRLEKLRKRGVKDFRKYLNAHPQVSKECAGLVRVVNVNQATLELYAARDKEELLQHLDLVLSDESYKNFSEELVHIAEGRTNFQWEGVNQTLDGRRLNVSLLWSAAPGHENDLSKILVSIVDITEQAQAEAALRESEKRYRTLVEQLPVAIYRDKLDEDATNLFVSPQIQDFTGYTPEEWMAEPMLWRKSLHPDDREWVLAENERHYKNYEPFLCEYRLMRRNGSVVWVRDEAAVIFDDSGDAQYSQGLLIDISARKQAEETLRLQSAALESAANAIFITDSKGGIEWVNPAFTLLTGYSAREAIGKNPRELVRSGKQGKTFYENLWNTILSGETWRGEFINRRKDGSHYSEEAVITPLKDARGEITHFIGVKQDISQRRQAEEHLRQLKDFNESIIQNMIEGVITTDTQGLITYINPAMETLLGYASTELIGRPWLELIPEDQWEIGRSADHRRALGETDRYELEIRRKNGAALWALIGGSPLYDPRTGNVSGSIGVIADITERRQAEAELRRRANEFSALYETTRDLAAQQELMTLLNVIVERARGLLHAPSGGMYLYNESRNHLEMVLSSGAHTSPGTILQMGEGLAGYVAQTLQPHILEDYSIWESRARKYEDIPFRAVIQAPMLYADELIGVLSVEELGASERKFTQEDLHLLTLFANQAALAVGKARLFEETRQRVTELEVLFESSLAFGGALELPAIGEKIVKILAERLKWHHAVVHIKQPDSDTLEVIGYGAPGLNPENSKAESERLNNLISRTGQGMTGWVVQHGETVRCDDLKADARYIETYPGIQSGLYAPMKAGDDTLGAIGVESESKAAFDADDERLLTTLAAQAAAAIQTARLFERTKRRVIELETLNRISIALRAVPRREEMLAIVLEEALNALGSVHGSINLWQEATQKLHNAVARGWVSEISKEPIKSGEGIFGSVFASGKTYVSRDFSADSTTRASAREQIPPGWGGICAPIMSSERTLGVLLAALPGKSEPSKDQIRLLNTIAEMTGAALHRLTLFDQTANHLETLQALRIVDQAISASFDLRPVLEIVLNQAISRLGMDAASILLLNPHSQMLEYAAGRWFSVSRGDRVSMRLGQGLSGRAALERRLLHYSNLTEVLDANQISSLPEGESFEEYYAAPLIAKGEVKGVLEVFHHTPLSLDAEQLDFLETLAGQAAIAVDNIQLFDGMQRVNLELAVAYDATIEGWSNALELRDQETEGHSQRVTELTIKLAKSMNLNGLDLNHIRRGALLHDIGKMGIPDSILLKPGALTKEEWDIMRQHPQFAYQMLAPITYLRSSLDIPWCHHENWDGTGYPRGLKGDQIPLAARIFALVDVYDALTSDRPYRKAWTKEDTLAYVVKESGKHFDPYLVEKFLLLIAQEEPFS